MINIPIKEYSCSSQFSEKSSIQSTFYGASALYHGSQLVHGMSEYCKYSPDPYRIDSCGIPWNPNFLHKSERFVLIKWPINLHNADIDWDTSEGEADYPNEARDVFMWDQSAKQTKG